MLSHFMKLLFCRDFSSSKLWTTQELTLNLVMLMVPVCAQCWVCSGRVIDDGVQIHAWFLSFSFSKSWEKKNKRTTIWWWKVRNDFRYLAGVGILSLVKLQNVYIVVKSLGSAVNHSWVQMLPLALNQLYELLNVTASVFSSIKWGKWY